MLLMNVVSGETGLVIRETPSEYLVATEDGRNVYWRKDWTMAVLILAQHAS